MFAPYTDAFKVDEVSTIFARFFMETDSPKDWSYLYSLNFKRAVMHDLWWICEAAAVMMPDSFFR